ncbi:hypothetical protein KR018_000245 [Drosophila ironensis]|nr:hypothetical protein KR018_000245 [Drosophila ironensis]
MASKSWTLPRLSQSGPSGHSLLSSVRLTYALCAFASCCLHAAMRNMLGMVILKMVMTRPEDQLDPAFKLAQQVGQGNVTEPGRCGGLRTGDLPWTRSQQLTFPGIYYYGYVVSIFLSGHLADRCSSKRLFILSHICVALVYILLPTMAHYSFEAAAVNLVACGILAVGLKTRCIPLPSWFNMFLSFKGGGNPVMYKLFVTWAHPTERTALISFAYSGLLLGSMVIYPLSGFLSEFTWELPFYVVGAATLTFGIACWWLIYDSLEQHPRISETELAYLQQGCLGKSQLGLLNSKVICLLPLQALSVPWSRLLTSVPAYAFMLTHMCHTYTYLVLALLMPRIIRESLEFDLHVIGFFSSVPFLGACCSKVICILGSSYLERRMGLQQNWIRKVLYVSCSFVAISSIVVIVLVDCRYRILVLLMLALLMAASDMGFSVYWPTLLYFAPSFAGLISGVSNGMAHLSGFLAPHLVASLVDTVRLLQKGFQAYLFLNTFPQGSKSEWDQVLMTLIAFNVLAMLVFGLGSSTHLQPWDPRSSTEPPSSKETKNNC